MADTITWMKYTPGGLGTSIDLNDGVNYICELTNGEAFPMVTHITEEIPDFDGLHLKEIKVGLRQVQLALKVVDTSLSGKIAKLRALAKELKPVEGHTGQLGWIRSGSTEQRVIYCDYAGGLNQVKDKGGYLETTLVFQANDNPYWGATVASAKLWNPTTIVGNFFPFFPMKLSHSSIFAQETITNSGDVKAWPQWSFVGPGSDPAIYNLTTGKQIQMTVNLSAGQVLNIDTSPGKKSVTDIYLNYYTNVIQSGSSMFPIEPGDNIIRVEFSGTNPSSYVTLAYYKQYLTP